MKVCEPVSLFINSGKRVVLGKRSKELRKSVNEKTISNEECRASDYSADAIKEGMICATGEGSRGVEDSCQVSRRITTTTITGG